MTDETMSGTIKVTWTIRERDLNLPPGDDDFATRWMLIKRGFTRAIPAGEWVCGSRTSKRERGIWQRRYWEHLIRDKADFRVHVDYCHFNPVKHGHVSRAADWPYSSIHRYIRNRAIPVDWGGEVCAAGSIHVRWD